MTKDVLLGKTAVVTTRPSWRSVRVAPAPRARRRRRPGARRLRGDRGDPALEPLSRLASRPIGRWSTPAAATDAPTFCGFPRPPSGRAEMEIRLYPWLVRSPSPIPAGDVLERLAATNVLGLGGGATRTTPSPVAERRQRVLRVRQARARDSRQEQRPASACRDRGRIRRPGRGGSSQSPRARSGCAGVAAMDSAHQAPRGAMASAAIRPARPSPPPILEPAEPDARCRHERRRLIPALPPRLSRRLTASRSRGRR